VTMTVGFMASVIGLASGMVSGKARSTMVSMD
jgi:hypothetical protein